MDWSEPISGTESQAWIPACSISRIALSGSDMPPRLKWALREVERTRSNRGWSAGVFGLSQEEGRRQAPAVWKASGTILLSTGSQAETTAVSACSR